MQINVSIDGLDGVDLSTVVGQEIAWYNPETEETEYRPRTLGDMVAERLADKTWGQVDRLDLIREARALRAEVIREKVEPIITEALTKGFQLTNTYGEPTGQEVTLAELIVAEAKKTIGGSRSDYGRGEPLAQRLVKDQVGAVLTKELKDAIAEEKAKVVTAIRARASEIIAKSIEAGLGR